MVTYTEEVAYRHRNRNRRVVVLKGTIESGDAATHVPLVAGNASINSIDAATLENAVVGSGNAIASYNGTEEQVNFYDQDLTDNTTDLTDDTFTVKVVGPEE